MKLLQTLFFIHKTILRGRYDYPCFAVEVLDSEGLNNLAKTILLLRAEVTLRTGHFIFKAGGPFPTTCNNTGESGMLRWSSKSMAVSEMFVLLSSCLCKGFQYIPAPEKFTPGERSLLL